MMFVQFFYCDKYRKGIKGAETMDTTVGVAITSNTLAESMETTVGQVVTTYTGAKPWTPLWVKQ